VVAQTLESHGGLDILINNAGINFISPLATFPLSDYRRVIEVNQIGVFLGMRACLPALVRGGEGSIINVSSIAGLQGCPCSAAYVASKYAVIGMTKVAALELGKFNVRVNSIHPGLLETRLTQGVTLDMQVPLDRLGKGIEVARLSLFLASSDSSYCTGQQFVVDGGLTSGDGPSAFFTMASDAVIAATAGTTNQGATT
jgi:3alpha(or 20beta)-hydroxysteroid dehydrogenase